MNGFNSFLDEIPEDKIDDYKFIYLKTKDKGNRIAFHRADADGIVSAVIVRNSFLTKKLVFIPIGYEALKMVKFGSYLANLSWFAVVDLPPFPVSKFNFFFDHHKSNENLEILAHTSVFDPKAPSAAYLLAQYFHNIDDKTKELAKLTEITDTVNYSIPPPLGITSKYVGEQERAWALNDVCKSLDSDKDIVKLVERLGLEGFEAIPRYYNERIAKHRSKRRESIEIAKQVEASELTILTFPDDTLNRFAILHELFNKGAKVGIAITKDQSNYLLNFRHSKQLREEERLKYRLDQLAQKFGGGGHVSASGAKVISQEDALKKIIAWGEKKGLTITVKNILSKE